jgi:hypothetical protein
MDFHDLEQWRRAAALLVRQVYRSKFIFGDMIEDIDRNAAMDKAGELHIDDLPPDVLRADALSSDADERLRTAEGVIRKLYVRSMELTSQNAALREENDRLRAQHRRPRSAQGAAQLPLQPDAPPDLPATESGDGAPPKDSSPYPSERSRGGGGGGGGGLPARDGARSVPPELMAPSGAPGAGKARVLASGAQRAALEALAPGSTSLEQISELQAALKASELRAERLRTEIEQVRARARAAARRRPPACRLPRPAGPVGPRGLRAVRARDACGGARGGRARSWS